MPRRKRISGSPGKVERAPRVLYVTGQGGACVWDTYHGGVLDGMILYCGCAGCRGIRERGIQSNTLGTTGILRPGATGKAGS